MPIHVLPPIIITIVLMVGCAGPQARPQSQSASPVAAPQAPIEKKEKVVYLVPKTVTPSISPLKYVHLRGGPVKRFSSGFQEETVDRTVCEADRQSNEVICTRSRAVTVKPQGFAPATWNSYLKYYVSITTEETADRYVLTLEPRLKEAKAEKTLTKKVLAPQFTEDELYELLESGSVGFKMEFDSQYDEKSVSANFTRRIGKSVNLLDGYSGYTLVVGKTTATLKVKLWPYRGGSKAEISATVNLYLTDAEPGIRTIDVQKILDVVKKEIENIVNG